MAHATVTVDVRLPSELAARIEALAKLAGVSTQASLRVILAAETLRHRPPEPPST